METLASFRTKFFQEMESGGRVPPSFIHQALAQMATFFLGVLLISDEGRKTTVIPDPSASAPVAEPVDWL